MGISSRSTVRAGGLHYSRHDIVYQKYSRSRIALRCLRDAVGGYNPDYLGRITGIGFWPRCIINCTLTKHIDVLLHYGSESMANSGSDTINSGFVRLPLVSTRCESLTVFCGSPPRDGCCIMSQSTPDCTESFRLLRQV